MNPFTKRVLPVALGVAFVLPMGAMAQDAQPQTPAAASAQDSSGQPMTKAQMKQQRAQQKAAEKTAKENAKAAKEQAKALEHQNKATDAEEKAQRDQPKGDDGAAPAASSTPATQPASSPQ